MQKCLHSALDAKKKNLNKQVEFFCILKTGGKDTWTNRFACLIENAWNGSFHQTKNETFGFDLSSQQGEEQKHLSWWRQKTAHVQSIGLRHPWQQDYRIKPRLWRGAGKTKEKEELKLEGWKGKKTLKNLITSGQPPHSTASSTNAGTCQIVRNNPRVELYEIICYKTIGFCRLRAPKAGKHNTGEIAREQP